MLPQLQICKTHFHLFTYFLAKLHKTCKICLATTYIFEGHFVPVVGFIQFPMVALVKMVSNVKLDE